MSDKNQELFERAKKVIPGGVNSPVRAFGAVGGTPRFITAGKGAQIQDSNGKWYLDYVGSWGPLILGHAHPEILQVLRETAEFGLSFGAPTEREIELAETVCSLIPSLDMLRLVSSGTEATMSAIRLARGYTKRDLLIKFEGCYHGHSDSLLIKAGSGALTFGNPSSAGVPADIASKTLVLPYNDSEALKQAFSKYGEQIAAVIIEPIAGNMNLVIPEREYLNYLRTITKQYGSVLIFDEVMSGFRVALGGVQGLYQITPDLSTFGKIIGGGLPLAAFGGRREIMEKLAPLGAVYQAGTLSGNPMAVAAGLKQLQLLQQPGLYQQLAQNTEQLCQGLTAAAQKYQVRFCAASVGSMFGLYFSEQPPVSYQQVLEKCDKAAFNHFFHAMLEQGHYFAPSAYEAGFVSTAHSLENINATIKAAEEYFHKLSAK